MTQAHECSQSFDAYQVWSARIYRAARVGCVGLLVSLTAGGVTLYAGLQTLANVGVHVEPGFAPLSLTSEIASPCATMLSGRETTERWRHVSVRRTVGFNPQAWDWWSAADEDIGYEICK